MNNNNKLEFNVESMSELEYKIREISTLSNEELLNLDRDKQVIFAMAQREQDGTSVIVAMAPKAWFISEQEFKDRMCSEEFIGYIKEPLGNIAGEAIATVSNLIDNMGLTSFVQYLTADAVQCADTNREMMGDVLDPIQYEAFETINIAACGMDLLDNEENLMDRIQSEEVMDGYAFIHFNEESDEKESIDMTEEVDKYDIQAYIIRIVLDREYGSREDDDYYDDIEKIYATHLDMGCSIE